MTEIETYAVGLVGSGARSYAEDDMDEDHEFQDRNDFRAAQKLGVKMALTIERNPDAFLRWYRDMALRESVR